MSTPAAISAPAPLPPPVVVKPGIPSGLMALTGIQKAAVLMVILGEQTSADVLRELDEDECGVLVVRYKILALCVII